MTGLSVRVVAPEGAERDAFDDLPEAVYAGDPMWAPGSADVARQCFDDAAAGLIRLHPVVVDRAGRAVARAAGIIDPGARDGRGAPQGWVGLVECLAGEQEAGVRAIVECRRWVGGAGVASVAAPRSSALVAGLLVEGFDHPQTYLTAHNPAWYLSLFEAAGLRPVVTMRAFEFTRARAPRFRLGRARGFRVRSADPGRLDAELGSLAGLQEAVFAGRAGHVNRGEEGMRRLLARIRPAVDPDLVVLAEDGEGQVIGALICLADVWQRRPAGAAPDRARLLSAGVLPPWRGRGVAVAMGRTLAEALLDKGYRTLEASWVMADNIRPQLVVRALGARPTRRFALFG